MNNNAQIAELQDLCRRTLSILESEGFFKCNSDGFWHSSLHRDLTKAASGKELKQLSNYLMLAHRVIKELEENK